jgi:Flp pilus assembly protein TadD
MSHCAGWLVLRGSLKGSAHEDKNTLLVTALEELYDSEPAQVHALFNSARGCIEDARYEDAERLLMRFATELPGYDDGIVWYELADLLEIKGDISGADTAYRKALSFDPMYQVYLEAFAYFLFRNGNSTEALSVMRTLRGAIHGASPPKRYDRFIVAIEQGISYDAFTKAEGPEWWRD